MWGSSLLMTAGFLFFATVAQAICIDEIHRSTPDNELVDNGDGTVTDRATGLTWKQCSEGKTNDSTCSGKAAIYTWQQALNIPVSLNASSGYAGYTDWRLPNVSELRSLVEIACYEPAINSTRFPNTGSSFFWSSTILSRYEGQTWNVNFSIGRPGIFYRSHRERVRLVRGGQ